MIIEDKQQAGEPDYDAPSGPDYTDGFYTSEPEEDGTSVQGDETIFTKEAF